MLGAAAICMYLGVSGERGKRSQRFTSEGSRRWTNKMVDVRANELDEGGYLQRVHSERIPASTKDDEEEGEGIDSLG